VVQRFQKNGITDQIREQYTTVNRQLLKVTNELMTVTSELQKAWDDMSILMLTRKYPDPDEEEENGINKLDEQTIATILRPRKLSIFISYKNNEAKTLPREVKDIEKIFTDYGIKEVIHYNSMAFMTNIGEFMKQVRTTSFALLFIDKDFLESPETMSQVLQLRKDENYKDRMALLVHSDVDIYGSTLKAIPYIKYWDEKIRSFEKQVKEAGSVESLSSLSAEAKLLIAAKSEIDLFINSIVNSNVPPYEKLKEVKLLPILQLIVSKTVVIPK